MSFWSWLRVALHQHCEHVEKFHGAYVKYRCCKCNKSWWQLQSMGSVGMACLDHLELEQQRKEIQEMERGPQ